MSHIFNIHPVNPQIRIIREAVKVLQDGGVIVYPTDAGYALGCHLGDKQALIRIRQIRNLSEKHYFSLVCRDLSEISVYAKVDNPTYRFLKSHTPGAYTFLLQATKETPRRLLHPKRKIIGIRVPKCHITLALLEELGEPLMSSSLILPGEALPEFDPEKINEKIGSHVDAIIDGGQSGIGSTSIIDLTGKEPQVIREGKGDTSDLY